MRGARDRRLLCIGQMGGSKAGQYAINIITSLIWCRFCWNCPTQPRIFPRMSMASALLTLWTGRTRKLQNYCNTMRRQGIARFGPADGRRSRFTGRARILKMMFGRFTIARKIFPKTMIYQTRNPNGLKNLLRSGKRKPRRTTCSRLMMIWMACMRRSRQSRVSSIDFFRTLHVITD